MECLTKLLLCLFFPLTLWAQKQPEFRNGKERLSTFMRSNQKYPQYSKTHCIQGTVRVQFNLDRKGNLYNVKVINGTGMDLDEEALRLVYLTQGKWMIEPGYDTTQKLEIPIQFQLNSEDCKLKSVVSTDKAKMDYQAERAMFSTIENFYESVKAGNRHTEAETIKIESLKTQLGIDDEYFRSLLLEAKRDLKNKDIYSAKHKALKIRSLGSNIADAFIDSQLW